MQQLFLNLMNLCKEDRTKFYFVDVKVDLNTTARIFSYHYASYSDWLQPDALECRGIMFEIDAEEKPVRVLCRPMEKFFNLYENPFTMDLDLSKVEYLMEKADGSLVSSYVVGGFAYLKSKTSVSSTQAYDASKLLNQPEHAELRDLIKSTDDITFNFEYVAPNNRIVLGYSEPALILLNARYNETGEYLDYAELESNAVTRRYLVPRYKASENWVEETRNAVGVEGYVAQMEDGTKFKVKSEWYVALHRTKDSITSNENLFKAIVEGTSDDLRAMFLGDDESIEKINDFESAHMEAINKHITIIESLRAKVAGKDRKDFAIIGQTDLAALGEPQLFSILMRTYNEFVYEEVLGYVNDMFLKYYQRYIPQKYK